ncbi:MAG TPA: hypothetical protein VF252_09115, partial [Gemmatimonadales bacterium]
DWPPRTLALIRRSRTAVLSSVALVTGRDKVGFRVFAARRESLDVVNHCPHVVKQRGSVATPVRVEVRERGLVSGLFDEELHEPESRAEDGGPVAPSAKPAVAKQNAYLHIQRDLGPNTPQRNWRLYGHLSPFP